MVNRQVGKGYTRKQLEKHQERQRHHRALPKHLKGGSHMAAVTDKQLEELAMDLAYAKYEAGHYKSDLAAKTKEANKYYREMVSALQSVKQTRQEAFILGCLAGIILSALVVLVCLR